MENLKNILGFKIFKNEEMSLEDISNHIKKIEFSDKNPHELFVKEFNGYLIAGVNIPFIKAGDYTVNSVFVDINAERIFNKFQNDLEDISKFLSREEYGIHIYIYEELDTKSYKNLFFRIPLSISDWRDPLLNETE